MTLMKWIKTGFVGSVTFTMMSGAAMAATVFDQGFETDTSGWLTGDTGWNGSIQREDATDLGVTPFEGSFAGRFSENGDGTGPFTRFDGYRDTFPGTYSAQAAIYLDPMWSLGSGFDYAVASNGSDGLHQRDFIFHVTKDTSSGDLLVGGSNNTNFAPREDLDTFTNSFLVASSGWYIFEHLFRDDGGVLAVDLNLRNSSGGLLFTETRSTAADTIPGEIGGNRYGWFTDISVDNGILVDSTQLNVPAAVPLPAAGWLLLTAFGGLGFAARRRRKMV